MKNKKSKLKKAILLCLCLYSGIACAQVSGTVLAYYGDNSLHNIIRNRPGYNEFLNASRSSVTPGINIALTDLTSLINANLPDNYEIYDMEIIDDTVFFCGQYLNGMGDGFLGWFVINDLFYSGGNIFIDRTLSSLGLKMLENIELFRDKRGMIHVVGYGLSDNPLGNHHSAFEAMGFPVSGMQYRVADLYCAGNQSDITDVAVTDNYVVYLQTTRNQACPEHFGTGVDFQVFPKYDMFSGAYSILGQFKTMTSHYHYEGGYTYIRPDNSDPHSGSAKMVYIEADMVAVCTHRADLDYSIATPPVIHIPGQDCFYNVDLDKEYLAFRIYDLSPIQMNHPIVMTTAAIAELPGEGYTIDCLLYYQPMKTYIVQHRHNNAYALPETAFTKIDFSAGGVIPSYVYADYLTMINTTNDWLPENICCSNTGIFVASGFHFSDFSHHLWKGPINPIDGNCNNHQQYPLYEIPTQEGKDDIFLTNASSWTPLVFLSSTPDTWSTELLIKCD